MPRYRPSSFRSGPARPAPSSDPQVLLDRARTALLAARETLITTRAVCERPQLGRATLSRLDETLSKVDDLTPLVLSL